MLYKVKDGKATSVTLCTSRKHLKIVLPKIELTRSSSSSVVHSRHLPSFLISLPRFTHPVPTPPQPHIHQYCHFQHTTISVKHRSPLLPPQTKPHPRGSWSFLLLLSKRFSWCFSVSAVPFCCLTACCVDTPSLSLTDVHFSSN